MKLSNRPLLLITLLILLAVPADQAVAQSKTILWQHFNVTIDVQTNGDLHVTEDWRVEFIGGPWSEGFREIPTGRTSEISDFRVYDSSGDAGEYTVHISNSNDVMTATWDLPQITNKIRSFTLTYVVKDAILIDSSGDQLSFEAVPKDWGAPIDSALVTVNLPSGADFLTQPESFGVQTQYNVSAETPNVVTFEATQGFFGQGLAFTVVFTHGVVTASPPVWQRAEEVQAWISINIVLITIILMLTSLAAPFMIWYLWGRDPKIGPVPSYITKPPSDLPPGLVGLLVDERADLRDITATLIDLADRGYLEMEEREKEGHLGSALPEYVFITTDKDTSHLAPFESQLYEAFMDKKNERSLSMPSSLRQSLLKIKSDMHKEITQERKLFRANPVKIRLTYIGWATAIGLLGFIVSMFILGNLAQYGNSVACLTFAPMLFAMGLLVISKRMPAKTRKGAKEAALWLAFANYLKNIKKYADLKDVADQFERYLPYAVALGIERQWVYTFSQLPADVATVPMPGWYRPYGYDGPRYRRHHPGDEMPAGEGLGFPSLNQMGSGMTGELNNLGSGLIEALNTAGHSFNFSSLSSGSSDSFSSDSFSGSGFSGGDSFSSDDFSGGGSGGFH